MNMQHIVSLALAALTAVGVVGCSETNARDVNLRQEFSIPPDMPVRDLGVVELRADMPKRILLGDGKDCTITATLLTNGLLQMDVAYTAKEEVVKGQTTHNFSQRSQFLLPVGRGCAPKLGEHLTVVMRPAMIQ
jgi:hypothetical protein